jgi:NADH-quinone oxidoreductase subunit B
MALRRRVANFMISGSTERHALVDESSAFPDAFATTRLADAVNWARKYSFFPYPFVTACCGMEYFSVAGPRYDIDRFGAALPRFTPRQADLLFVVGTITQRNAPILRRVYQQMAEPKWVVSFGACTSSGGPYDNYAVLQGIDRVVPVHLYIPGCPPRPEAVLDGLMKLQNRVQHERPNEEWDGLKLHGSGRKID